MNNSKKMIRRYCRQLRGLLPCGWWEKRKLISSLRQQMTAYAAENPDFTENDLHNHFGTPEEVAVTCLENTDSSQLLDRIISRNYIVKTVTACIMVALLIWGSVVCSGLYNYWFERHGFIIVTTEKTH